MARTLLGSASALHRTLECPASHHLPQDERPAGEAATRGQDIHLYLQRAPSMDQGSALESIPERWRKYCEKIDVKATAGNYTPMHLREVAMVHNALCGSVRVLDCEDRNYGDLSPYDTPGTADAVITGFRLFEVWDYKTGKTPVEAKSNPQLLHLALMTVRALAPYATQGLVGIQTLKGYGKIVNDCAPVDLFTLEAHEERVRDAQDGARKAIAAIEAGEQPEVNPGPWCNYCPAKAHCPEIKR